MERGRKGIGSEWLEEGSLGGWLRCTGVPMTNVAIYRTSDTTAALFLRKGLYISVRCRCLPNIGIRAALGYN